MTNEELMAENEILRAHIAARDKFLRETWEIIGSYAMGDTHDMVSKRKVFQAVHKGLKDAGIVCSSSKPANYSGGIEVPAACVPKDQ